MFDSNGRLRPGISSGSFINSIGDYDQCRNSVVPKEKRTSLETKYCLAQIDLSSKANQLSTLTGQPKSLFAPIGGRPAKIGLCLPKNCTSNDVTTFTDHILSSSLHDNELYVQTIQCDDDHESVESSSIVLILTIVMAILFIATTTSATILDLSSNTLRASKLGKQGKSRLINFINIFSICRGYKRLMSKRLDPHSNKQLDLRAIDGLRAISMFWIIVIHSYNFAFQWLLFDNLNIVDNVYKVAPIQWIANGTFSVDNFFLISGFLAWFKCLNIIGFKNDKSKLSKKQIDWERVRNKEESSDSSNVIDLSDASSFNSNRRLLIKEFSSNICARYLRLVPTMMFLILISVSLLPRLSWTPNWSNATIMFDEWCHFNWYLNVLLLQNFINTPNMCFSHSWYLAVDFQLFIMVNLIILMICYFSKRVNILIRTILYTKWFLLAATISAQLLIATLVYRFRMPSAPLVPVDSLESMLNYYGLIYIKPYYWLTSYSIGFLLAICLMSLTVKELTIQKKGRKSNDNDRLALVRVRKFVLIIQLISPCILIGLILSILPYFKGKHKMIGTLASLHALFARPLWSLSLASMLFVILQKKSKIISRSHLLVYRMVHTFLTLKLWLPLSRLTYSAYLFHPIVMAIFYGSRKETFKFSHSLIFYFCLGNIVLTYIGSLFIYLTIELPIQIAIKQIITMFLIRIRKNKSHLSSTATRKRSNFLGLSIRRPR